MIDCRLGSPADAAVIGRVRQAVWQEIYRGIYPDPMLDEADLTKLEYSFTALLSDPKQQYYLYFHDSQCIGFFSFGSGNYGPYKDFELCLNHLYIRRAYKGLGLGRNAFQVLYNYCREKGISKFYCGCNFHNTPAVDFYRHMGGIQGDDPCLHENKCDDIIHFEFYTGVEI